MNRFNDRVGEYHDTLDSIFHRLLVLEEHVKLIVERLNWLENPDQAPKPPKTKVQSEPEGKL